MSTSSGEDADDTLPSTPLVHPTSSSSDTPTPDDVPLSSSPSIRVPEGTYSPFVAYCVTVNYILGVGVIGMPKAFVTGGWLLSTVVLFVVSIMAAFTALWYVEVGHRANKREKRGLEGAEGEHVANGLAVSLPSSPSLPSSHSPSLALSKQPRRIENNELISTFFSPAVGRLYELLLCVYLMGSMWSYTSVFSTGMAANVPIPFLNNSQTCVVSSDRSSSCYSLYLFYNLVFACLTVPIATRNLTEMKLFVVALAMLRFVAITCMVITTIDMLYRFPAQEGASAAPPYYSDVSAVNWGGLGIIFPVCIFAQIFHHSVPGIAYPLSDKKKVPQVFSACLLSMFVLYSALSITLSLYFGSSIASQCTINWQNYTGYAPSQNVHVSTLTAFTRWLIVLFPPLDVLSAFPLKAITVGNNVQTRFLTLDEQNIRRKFIPFRLVAALVPIIGACIFDNLTVLLTYTGSLGIVIAFIFPTLLQWKSKKEIQGRSGVLEGWVEKVVDSDWSVYGVGGFCVAGLLTIIIQTVQGATSH